MEGTADAHEEQETPSGEESDGMATHRAPRPRRPITSASLPSAHRSPRQASAQLHASGLRPYSSVGGLSQLPKNMFAPNPVYEGVRAARQRMEESGSGLRHETSSSSIRFQGAFQHLRHKFAIIPLAIERCVVLGAVALACRLQVQMSHEPQRLLLYCTDVHRLKGAYCACVQRRAATRGCLTQRAQSVRNRSRHRPRSRSVQ